MSHTDSQRIHMRPLSVTMVKLSSLIGTSLVRDHVYTYIYIAQGCDFDNKYVQRARGATTLKVGAECDVLPAAVLVHSLPFRWSRGGEHTHTALLGAALRSPFHFNGPPAETLRWTTRNRMVIALRDTRTPRWGLRTRNRSGTTASGRLETCPEWRTVGSALTRGVVGCTITGSSFDGAICGAA